MTKILRTNEEWRAESLETLYQAGLAVFSEKGFRGATIDEIARLAKMSKAGVFFYFANKDRYLAHIVRRIAADYIDAAIATASRETDVVNRIVKFLHLQVNYSVDHTREICLFVLLSMELRNVDSESALLIKQKYKEMRDFIESVTKEGILIGRFAPDLRLRETSSTFMAVHDGVVMEWLRRGEELDGSELVRVFRRALLASLLPVGARKLAGRLNVQGKPSSRRAKKKGLAVELSDA